MVKVAITSQELIVLLSPQCFLLLAPQGLFQFPWPCCPAPFYWYKRIIELQFSVELRSRWDMAVKHTSSQQLTPPPPKIHLPWGLSSGAGGKESKKTLGAQCLLRWHCRFLGTPHAIKGSFVPRCNTPQRHLSKGCILNKKQHFPFWFLKVRLLSVMLQFMHWLQGNGTAAWGKKFFFPTLPLLCGNSSGSSHVHKLPPTWCGIIPLAFPVPLNHLINPLFIHHPTFTGKGKEPIPLHHVTAASKAKTEQASSPASGCFLLFQLCLARTSKVQWLPTTCTD